MKIMQKAVCYCPRWIQPHILPWTAGLRPCGVYYEGFVIDLEGVLQKHHVDTVSTFSIRKSRQTVAGKQHAKIELDNENQVNFVK